MYQPSAQILTTYAGVIAGRRALMLRYMPTQDVREGDRIAYQGLNWRVQPLETAESYTFTNEVLIVTITQGGGAMAGTTGVVFNHFPQTAAALRRVVKKAIDETADSI